MSKKKTPVPYTPKPLDTGKIVLPPSLQELLEKLAENAHEAWAVTRMAQGWTYGTARDDTTKKHPSLIPYRELTEAEKDLDRVTAGETLKAILLLGYTVTDPA